MEKITYWLFQNAIGIDQQINALLGGYADETLSSRAHRMREKVQPYWRWTATGADPLRAAQWASQNQGRLYDWQSIARYLFWILPSKASRGMCSEVCATMLGVPAEDAHLFDPRVLRAAVKGLS